MLKKIFIPGDALSRVNWIDRQKYVTLSILLSSSVFILLFFLVIRYLQGNMYMVKANAVGALIVAASAWLLRSNFNYYDLASRLFILLTFTLAMVNMNLAEHGSRAIWLASIIVAAFYFRDRREGLVWTAFFITTTLISEYVTLNKATTLSPIDYVTLIVNILLISLMLCWYEKIKEHDREALLDQNKLLEKKVAERTEQLEKISITDELTGMYNRRHLYQSVERLINGQRRDGKNLVFAMMDIDGFKEYNDNYGHFAGDEALKKVADVVKKNLARADDYGFRIGGEEFAIIMLDIEPADAFEHIEKIRNEIAGLKIEHSSNPEKIITVSFGIEETVPDATTHIDKIYQGADKKLYTAKERGRNITVM